MTKKTSNNNNRDRKVLAQEAARIIIEHGIADYHVAKIKAAERMSMTDRGSLPSNLEIEVAVSEHFKIFDRESHLDLLHVLRKAALSAMELLTPFTPRLVGPVLHGTATANSAVNLHIFSDSAELITLRLQESNLKYQLYERRLKSRRDRPETFPGFRFTPNNSSIEATVFPINGMRQAPISSVDGKPMRRADFQAVLKLLKDT
ncbi:hypothetical protein OAI75_00430 [Woeseiaceae bacterium]|nr:hypothetical protein [Woeseiaceae bacterium]